MAIFPALQKLTHMYGGGDVIGRSTRARVIDYLDV